ncbi:hypothetical protein E2C01_059492 [Portunus trituberculatus]|uniref:Uncharacterized protein n=1 Tax=Portunus trituberculatus TaxID=210409 RepID=A0A5B7H8I8_PORTR|nr:hypothetical protein [Portunus trituberculatus]
MRIRDVSWFTSGLSGDVGSVSKLSGSLVSPDREVRRTLVLAFGNHYPEWMPFLTSDRGRDFNLCA